MQPARLYVIIGNPNEGFVEPPYSTDPRGYNLPLFNRPLTEEEFHLHIKPRVKAFILREDARRFACHCNMVSLQCPVYDWAGESWVVNDAETERMADDLS